MPHHLSVSDICHTDDEGQTGNLAADGIRSRRFVFFHSKAHQTLENTLFLVDSYAGDNGP